MMRLFTAGFLLGMITSLAIAWFCEKIWGKSDDDKVLPRK